jgi:pimeloyl-ACP methyl ester carboxylesterase
MPYAKVNGQELYFEDSQGPGVPVVLGHAFNFDSREFDALQRLLGTQVRLIRWDARGFGRTRWDGRPFTLWDVAEDAVGLMDHLGLERAVVGGHSQGGNVALRMAWKHPARVAGLVLLSSVASADDDATRRVWADFLAAWEAYGPAEPVLNAIVENAIGSTEHAAPWLETWRALGKGALRGPLGALTGREDLMRFLSYLNVPALVVHGTADRAVPLALGEQLAAALPRSTLVRLEGAGHSPVLTHAPQVAEVLRGFLQSAGVISE